MELLRNANKYNYHNDADEKYTRQNRLLYFYED